jgi:hypothetical protein
LGSPQDGTAQLNTKVILVSLVRKLRVVRVGQRGGFNVAERLDFARQRGGFSRYLVSASPDTFKAFGDVRSLRSAFFAVANR